MYVKIKRYRRGEQRGSLKECVVKVDAYDTWSADWTIAQIALPLLKQLRASKQGAPWTEDEDVPEELRSTSAPPKENDWDTDALHFKRWDWIMDEMIFAMQEIATDNENEPKPYTKPGKFEFDPIDPETGKGSMRLVGYETTPELQAINTAYHERVQNGCRLFGKYFQNLWD